jgi:hypothetical protein
MEIGTTKGIIIIEQSATSHDEVDDGPANCTDQECELSQKAVATR